MVFCCVGLFMIVLLWLLTRAWFDCVVNIVVLLHVVVVSLFCVWWFCGGCWFGVCCLHAGLVGLGLRLCYVGLLVLCLRLYCYCLLIVLF